jgi:hypothetical protein
MLKNKFSMMTKTLACLAPLGIAALGMNANAEQSPAQSPLVQQSGCDQPAQQNQGQRQGGPGYGQGPWQSRGGLGPGSGRGGPGEGRGAGYGPQTPPSYGPGYPAYGPGQAGPGYGPGYPGYGMQQYPAPGPYGPAQPYRPRPW